MHEREVGRLQARVAECEGVLGRLRRWFEVVEEGRGLEVRFFDSLFSLHFPAPIPFLFLYPTSF